MAVMAAVLAALAAAAAGAAAGIAAMRSAGLAAIGGRKKSAGIREKIASFTAKAAAFNGRFCSPKYGAEVREKAAKLNLENTLGAGAMMFYSQASALFLSVFILLLTEDMLLTAASLGAGFFIPGAVLNSKVKEREAKILSELPDCLDLIAAGVEGGLPLTAAAAGYAEKSSGEFALELSLALKSMKLGRGFSESLSEMEKKLGLKEITAFVNAMSQAEKSGGSIKAIIKAQAEESRARRFQEMKKKAHEAPVKLLIPLLIFIFPVVFIVLFGPVILRLMQGM